MYFKNFYCSFDQLILFISGFSWNYCYCFKLLSL